MLKYFFAKNLELISLPPLFLTASWILYRWFGELLVLESEDYILVLIGFIFLHTMPIFLVIIYEFELRNILRAVTMSALIPLVFTGSELFFIVENIFFGEFLISLSEGVPGLFLLSLLLVFCHCYYEMNAVLADHITANNISDKMLKCMLKQYHLAVAGLAGTTAVLVTAVSLLFMIL